MRAAFSKAEIESEITSRFGSAFKLHEKRPAEVISCGIPQIDSFIFGGFPRGAITEVFGPASSGRTSFMLSALAQATMHEEVCALVDTNNVFDPESATRAEINCERLLWIRCANNLEHAFKATDLLLQGGGFGLVLLDLGDVPAKSAKRIISSWWYRFRRTLEATPTALVVIAEESCVRSCASLALELSGEKCLWSSSSDRLRMMSDEFPDRFNNGNTGALSPPCSLTSIPTLATPGVLDLRRRMNQGSPPHSNLLQGLHFQVECQRPLYLAQREGEVFVNAAS
jgi:RecA DNA recombination protein